MTYGLVSVRDASYQHRAYLAEAVVQHRLTMEGRLLGWKTHEDVEAFHAGFALWANPVELRKGAGRSGSAYYRHGHYLRLLSRERHVLAYSHEVAHSLMEKQRGQGHTPLWAGAYIGLLRAIDPDAATLLRITFREARLTIEPVDMQQWLGKRVRRRRAV